MSAGPCCLEGCRGRRLLSLPPPALLAVSVPLAADTVPTSSSSSPGGPRYVALAPLPPSRKDTSHDGLGPPTRLHPDSIPSSKTLFPNKITSTSMGPRTQTGTDLQGQGSSSPEHWPGQRRHQHGRAQGRHVAGSLATGGSRGSRRASPGPCGAPDGRCPAGSPRVRRSEPGALLYRRGHFGLRPCLSRGAHLRRRVRAPPAWPPSSRHLPSLRAGSHPEKPNTHTFKNLRTRRFSFLCVMRCFT